MLDGSYIVPKTLSSRYTPRLYISLTLHIQGYALGAVAEVADILGKQFLLDEDHASRLFKIIGNKLREHLDRSDERIKARSDEDYDEEIEEDLKIEDEEDSFVLQKVSDVIHNSFGLNKQSLLPYFAQFLKEPCTDLVKPKRAWSDRQWGTFQSKADKGHHKTSATHHWD